MSHFEFSLSNATIEIFSTTVSPLIYILWPRQLCWTRARMSRLDFCTLHCSSFWPFKRYDYFAWKTTLQVEISYHEKSVIVAKDFVKKSLKSLGWNLAFLGNFLLKKNIEGIIIYALWFGINVTFLLSENSREIRVFEKRPRGVTSHQLCITPSFEIWTENLGFLQTELYIGYAHCGKIPLSVH